MVSAAVSGSASLLLLLASSVSAAPMLRLENSALVSQAVPGAASTTLTTFAYNAGDGSLSIGVSVPPSIAWLSASVGGDACTVNPPAHPCVPLQFVLNTANLARGTYTAGVTVSDPHAVDSPQVLTVTAIVGGFRPLIVDQYITPGTVGDILLTGQSGAPCGRLFAGCVPGYTASTGNGGMWLSIATNRVGTLAFLWTTWIHLAPPADMEPGTYTGRVTISGSTDDGMIPVTMRLTKQPIAIPSTSQIDLRLAQGGPAVTYPFLPPISLRNEGLGTLMVQGVSASGPGVGAYVYADLAIVSVDPGSLGPGLHSDGLVTIQCNGANCPVQVPVKLEIVPRGPPAIAYQGVVDNATFAPGTPAAPGDVTIAKGEQLSLGPPAFAVGAPLPASLGGATVLVNGKAAPLFYSSFGQVAFQMPTDTAPGTALVQVVRDGQAGNTVSLSVAERAPEIVAITDSSYNLRDTTHPVKAGELLILWAIGLGPTNPAVPDGQPAPGSPPAVVTLVPTVSFDGVPASPSFAGLSPGSVGLYQVIVPVPPLTRSGTVGVSLNIPGVYSRTAYIAVQ